MVVKGDSFSHMEVENGFIFHFDYGRKGSSSGAWNFACCLKSLGIMTFRYF